MNRRKFIALAATGLLTFKQGKGFCTKARLDLAHPDRREFWLSHPVVGDPSFDAFTRLPNNPVNRGQPR